MSMIDDYTRDLQYYTSEDGIRLAYRDEGEGMPVVMVGGINRNGIDYKYLAPHLGGVRQIRVDLRGRGASDNAPWETYLTHQEARDVVKLLDTLGIDRAAFIGTSRGGVLALELASFAKDRMLGVCLNDAPAMPPALFIKGNPGMEQVRKNLGRIPEARTHGQVALDREKQFANWYNVPEGRWYDEAQFLYRETENGLALTFDVLLREAMLRNLSDDKRWNTWAWFEACDGLPVALLRGEVSDLVSRDTVARMTARRPDMIYAEVPGRGHSPWLDEPESLAVIKTWLAACR